MTRVADLAAFFRIPAMVSINKFDLNPEEGKAIEAYARERQIGVLGRIPFDPQFTGAMVQGKTILEYDAQCEGSLAVERVWKEVAERLEL